MRRLRQISLKCSFLCTFAIALVVASLGSARSMFFTIPIQDPLPVELQKPVETLLQSLRPADARAALAATKTAKHVWEHDGTLFLRVEADCLKDRCMTVIARIENGIAVAEAVIVAGKNIVVADVGRSLWGRASFPIFLAGEEGSHLSLDRIGRVWVVGSIPDPSRSPPRFAPPSHTAPLPDDFGVFTRSLDALRQGQ